MGTSYYVYAVLSVLSVSAFLWAVWSVYGPRYEEVPAAYCSLCGELFPREDMITENSMVLCKKCAGRK